MHALVALQVAFVSLYTTEHSAQLLPLGTLNVYDCSIVSLKYEKEDAPLMSKQRNSVSYSNMPVSFILTASQHF